MYYGKITVLAPKYMYYGNNKCIAVTMHVLWPPNPPQYWGAAPPRPPAVNRAKHETLWSEYM